MSVRYVAQTPSGAGVTQAQLQAAVADKVNNITFQAVLSEKLDVAAAPDTIRDTLASTLVAGANVAITVNGDDTITIAAAGGGGGGGSDSAGNVVVHGTQAAHPRPNVDGPVIWIGSVEPDNDDDTQDVWLPVVESVGEDEGGGLILAPATASRAGAVMLAGDLGGTAEAPTVPGLAAKANISSLATVATVGTYDSLSGKPAADGAAGAAGLRSLGTGAQQAAAGNHTHHGLYPVIVNQSGSAYPARPVGAAIVIWRGSADPGALAVDGDEWRQV